MALKWRKIERKEEKGTIYHYYFLILLVFSLYYDAARLIDEFEGKKGSLKSLAFKCKGTSLPRKKALFVLLEKTIQS